MTDRYEVVVVGGGIAGLVAAATAATEGAEVALVEARRIGGRGRTSQHSGFLFNQGPHALYLQGALMSACVRLGVEVPGGPPAIDRAGVWSGGALRPLPLGARQVVKSSLLSWRGKWAARRVIGVMDDADPGRYAGTSLASFLDEQGAPADLARFVQMFARLSSYANAPDLVSAEAIIRQYRLGKGGVRYLDGGWQQMVDGLARAAQVSGAKILDHRGALGIGRDGQDWVVHTTDGDLAAGSVVLAAGLPAECERLAGDDPGWVADAGPAVRAACLDLGVSRPALTPLLLGMDEPYYLSTHAPPARLAPDAHHVIQVLRYLAPGDTPAREAAEAGLWQHAERAGTDRSAVVASRYLHDMVVAGGLPLASRQGLAGRPPVVVADRPGLFLAGDWVGAEGMIADAAAASGTSAGRAAAARSLQPERAR